MFGVDVWQETGRHRVRGNTVRQEVGRWEGAGKGDGRADVSSGSGGYGSVILGYSGLHVA